MISLELQQCKTGKNGEWASFYLKEFYLKEFKQLLSFLDGNSKVEFWDALDKHTNYASKLTDTSSL